MDRPTSRAGGRATEDGMRFQVRVGTWFAAHLVAGLPVGARFGVSAKSIPIKLQFETGSFLDDIVVQLSDSGQIMVQCKTRPNLSASPKSGFAATVAQLVELRTSLSRDCTSSEIANELSAVLAVSSKAPRSLDALEDACRFFDHGGNWEDGKQTLSKSRLRALERFESHARRAWLEATNGEATEIDLVWLARTFRIVRFDVDEGGADRR
ncbi:MAG: hypothetical protein F4213_16060 [Boseongicola sp. SB0677_bin_26]|nr:hypothetical protein [Boseongicola sp. SB0677_bin_26]